MNRIEQEEMSQGFADIVTKLLEFQEAAADRFASKEDLSELKGELKADIEEVRKNAKGGRNWAAIAALGTPVLTALLRHAGWL